MALEAINEIKEAEKKAEKIISEANQDAKEIEAIHNMSQDLKDNAINIVVERIVKIHGNS